MSSIINWQIAYKEMSPILLGICRRYVQDIAAAEDVVQDSFMTAIQKEHQLKDHKLLFAWLKKIVVNNALHYLKTANQNLFINSEITDIPDTDSVMIQNNDEEHLIMGYRFSREELLRSIDHLPAHHKSVFNLYFLEEYSHAQIAETLGININTSKSHLLRAKKGIRDYLVEHTDEKTMSGTTKTKMQILSVLGLGNLLWARNFQNAFRDFTIQPQNPIDLSDFNNYKAEYSNTAQYHAFFKRGLALVVIFAGFYWLNLGGNTMITANFEQWTNEADGTKFPTSDSYSDLQNASSKISSENGEAKEKPHHFASIEKKPRTNNTTTTAEKENKKPVAVHAKDENTAGIMMQVDSSTVDKEPVVIVKKVVIKVKVYVEK